MMDRHIAAFREEAAELLRELEGSLLELEERPGDADVVGRVFRALHTIKGSGAMFGFTILSGFTHRVETVFDGVREGRIPVTGALIGATLAARDHIQALLAAPEGGGEELGPAGEAILEQLNRAVREASEAPEPAAAAADAGPPEPGRAPAGEAATATWRIRFEPAPDILLTGANPLLLLRELGELGDLSLLAHMDRIPPLADFDPEKCYIYWDLILTTAAGKDAIRDVFIFVEDRARISIEPVGETEAGRVGDVLAARGDIHPEAIEAVIKERPRVGELLVSRGITSEDRVRAALLEQQHMGALRDKRQRVEAESTLRVPAAKLDSLVNIVGELVTMQARLSGYALESGDAEITFIAGEVERLTETLRESAMSMRMLPIGETFARFKRLVRDLSSDLGKRVDLVIEGAATELDKSVIEVLVDPLVHLIRNAIDHGIETPERRAAAGKPPVGRLLLAASHEGAFVSIRVADDGAGLDHAAIRARAIERGLIAPDAVLTEQQTAALILKPGFSTASAVSEISGRGVGTDVVQRGVEALRGTLTIKSAQGQGTTVTLRIPLTLAIIDGLLVEAGGDCFVVPLSNISSCLELAREREGERRQSLVSVRDQLVPYVVLRERFHIPGEAPATEQVIIAETREGPCGLVVDRVIGDHHTVVKKLGNLYSHVEEVSGATILGNGKVALILDVDKMARVA